MDDGVTVRRWPGIHDHSVFTFLPEGVSTRIYGAGSALVAGQCLQKKMHKIALVGKVHTASQVES